MPTIEEMKKRIAEGEAACSASSFAHFMLNLEYTSESIPAGSPGHLISYTFHVKQYHSAEKLAEDILKGKNSWTKAEIISPLGKLIQTFERG